MEELRGAVQEHEEKTSHKSSNNCDDKFEHNNIKSPFDNVGITEDEDEDEDDNDDNDNDDEEEEGKNSEGERLAEVQPGESSFEIVDACHKNKGKVMFEMDRYEYNLNEIIKWKATFKCCKTKLVKGAIIIIRIEEGDADLDETNLYDMPIFEQKDPIEEGKEVFIY